jgi:hypothetical protein
MRPVSFTPVSLSRKRLWRFFQAMVCLLLLSGCPNPLAPVADEELGRESWHNFSSLSSAARQSSSPYNTSLALRVTLPEERYILGAYVWSNGAQDGPIRLDLQNTVGSTVAKLKEESDYFLFFDIKNNVVSVSDNPAGALPSLGIPMPFTLADLSALLNGRYQNFFTGSLKERPALYGTTQDRQSIFNIEEGSRPGRLTLDARGYPVKWESERGWRMELSYQDVTSLVANVTPLPGPDLIRVSGNNDYSISIQVKSLKKLPKPFTEAQLELLIPSSASVRELKDMNPDASRR